MNEVILSAILKGGFEDISRDGLKFTTVIKNDYSDTGFDEFTCLAYGNAAKFLKQHAESGERLVLEGRLSSEKFDDDGPYHTAVTVSRVLAIAPSEGGLDFSHITLSGQAASDRGLITLDSGTTLANLDIKNVRTYTNRDGETNEYTTYLSATVWKERAEALEAQGLFDMMGDRDNRVSIILDGILKPRSYENNDGQTVEKVDIWVNDLYVVGQAGEEASAPAPAKREAPAKRAPSSKKSPF